MLPTVSVYSEELTDNDLREKLDELEKTRSRLIELGLLDKDENPNFPIQHNNQPFQALQNCTDKLLEG